MLELSFLILLLAPNPLPDACYPVQIESLANPVLAVQARITGEVRLRGVLNSDGSVANVIPLSGHPILARAAVENLKTWAFDCSCCGTKGASSVDLTYVFRLEGVVDIRPCSRFKYNYPYRVTVVSEAQHWMPASAARRYRSRAFPTRLV